MKVKRSVGPAPAHPLEAAPVRWQNAAIMAKDTTPMTEGQRAYEARRAAKAGLSLEKWLELKQKEREEEARARERAAAPPKPVKKPGLIGRLIERAHKPL